MTRHPFGMCLARWIAAILVFVSAGIASAQTPPPYVFSGPLLPLLLQMPENSWLHANANLYSNVWTPGSLEPLDGCCPQPPSKIILAWSGFGWDSNRGDLILWGGGHANYPGNDVYRWRSSNLMWERASLPSEIKTDPLLGQIAIDGVDNAPISSHTYDNNLFLPVADRFMTWGGAAYNYGGPFIRPLESNPTTQYRLTGPYLFDPNRADGNKVGGTTGSNVKRVSPTSIVGGQMWQNRDIHRWLAGQPLPGTHVNGCTGYAREGGLDVVYVASANAGATSLNLYRYQLTNLANPAIDQISKVGAYAVGVAGQTSCGYDPGHKLFVRTGNNTTPFQFWDLTIAGPANPDRSVQVNASIAALQSWMSANSVNIQNCGLEYDPTRARFALWCGAGVIWELTPPASGNPTTGWTATQRPVPPPPAPPGDVQTGVLGKWRYAAYYDAFIGLQDINDGDIWIYKPVGWAQPNPPGNALPTVSVTWPAAGTDVAPATTIILTASAADADGSIARVEYYVNGDKVGQATSAPYAVNIAPILVGSYSVVAVAVDNVGGMTASAPVAFTVSATLTTSVLQRGLSGYAGVSDTYLDAFAPTVVRGTLTALILDAATYRPLVRFAIFQSEGGPVPNGAVIQSATLALNKGYYDDTLQLNALLKPWVEGEATWTNASSGVPWTVGGAAGAGTDYSTTTDALVTPSWNPGWVSFDVTPRVRQWASGANYGWRMAQTTNGSNLKYFVSSESTTDTTLRPKVTVVYSSGATAPTYQLSGTVTLGGVALSGVNFATTSGASCTATDGAGHYACTVPPGWSGTVTPSLSGYTFTPSSRSYSNVAADQTAQNYSAAIDSTTGAWVDDAVPAGATLAGTGEGWSWVSSTPAPYSGALAHQSALQSGVHQHYFYNATTTLSVAVGDTLFAYVYLDPANPPREVMLQWNDGSWEHRAYWGANLIGWGTDGTVSRRYMGPLPAAGQWVLLAVPASQVGLEGRTLNGMAYTLYDGRATWDYAGKASATAVWVDDAVPAGATLAGTGEGWSWVSSTPAPYSGALAHQSALLSGVHQHYFYNATTTLSVAVGDTLFAYVYLDPANPPREVMLQWNDGSWEHRAYWGANLIGWGTDGTVSRRYMGPLPAAGQWVLLAVPASQVGLEGRTLNGMAYTLYDGRATWDHAGKVSATTVWVDDAVPVGATLAGMGEGWSWVSSNPAPYSGALAHQSALQSGLHQHYFYNTTTTLSVAVGDTLFAYVYLDPANPPREVMLQWNDGSWEHRAYWGANLIGWGTDGTASRRYMGPLPAAGQWVLLAVPASQVGLEGRTLNGMAYTLYDGRATWDYAGSGR